MKKIKKYKAVNLYLIKEFMCNTEFYYYNTYTQKIDLYAFEYHTISNNELESELEFLVNERTQEMYLVEHYLLNNSENRALACCMVVGKEGFLMSNLTYLQMFVIVLLIPTLTITLVCCLVDWKIEKTIVKYQILFKIFNLIIFIIIGKIYIESVFSFIFK